MAHSASGNVGQFDIMPAQAVEASVQTEQKMVEEAWVQTTVRQYQEQLS